MEKLVAITIMVSVAIVSVAGLIFTDKINVDNLAEAVATSYQVNELQNQIHALDSQVQSLSDSKEVNRLKTDIRVLGDRIEEVKLNVDVMLGVVDVPTTMKTGLISIPEGNGGSPGCEEKNRCYIPHTAIVNAGQKVTWINDDNSPHTVTSGTPQELDGLFNSELIISGDEFSFKFSHPGEYDYFCTVHPWETGKISVEDLGI